MKKFSFPFQVAATVLILACSCSRTSEDPAIRQDELLAHLNFLATDSLKGRYPGTPEDAVAAHYIAGEFKKAGLRLLNGDGLLPFEVTTRQDYGKNNNFSSAGCDAVFNQEFAPFPFSANDSLEAGVVFAGYGFAIDNGDLQWNDYEGMDVSGKWVMILRGNPEIDSSGSVYTNYSNDRDKAMIAKDHGAAGVLYVSGNTFDPQDELVTLRNRAFSTGLPAIHISRSLADQVLSASGKNIGSLEQSLNKDRKPHSFETGSMVSATSDLRLVKKTTYDVVAYLEGSDPAQRDKYLVIGAHYDHLGFGGPGSTSRQPDTVAIHYGADDNASGVSSIIEIAERLSVGDTLPALSCIFISFGAEEMGLLGSKYYIDHAPTPVKNVRMMFNLDMVGRLNDRSLQVGGTGTALETDSILDLVAARDSIEITRSPEGYGPSDHASFYAKDIPVLFFTSGPHPDYHTPRDRVDKIDLAGMQRIDNFVYDLVLFVGDMDNSLTFSEAGPKVKGPGRYGRNMVTLGIMPDFMSSDQYEGMRVDLVDPGRPAALGGMKKGDFITGIEGKKINNIYDYMYRMKQVSYGQQIIVTVKRDGKYLDLLVQL